MSRGTGSRRKCVQSGSRAEIAPARSPFRDVFAYCLYRRDTIVLLMLERRGGAGLG